MRTHEKKTHLLSISAPKKIYYFYYGQCPHLARFHTILILCVCVCVSTLRAVFISSPCASICLDSRLLCAIVPFAIDEQIPRAQLMRRFLHLARPRSFADSPHYTSFSVIVFHSLDLVIVWLISTRRSRRKKCSWWREQWAAFHERRNIHLSLEIIVFKL